jgi:hypothetical protein
MAGGDTRRDKQVLELRRPRLRADIIPRVAWGRAYSRSGGNSRAPARHRAIAHNSNLRTLTGSHLGLHRWERECRQRRNDRRRSRATGEQRPAGDRQIQGAKAHRRAPVLGWERGAARRGGYSQMSCFTPMSRYQRQRRASFSCSVRPQASWAMVWVMTTRSAAALASAGRARAS